MSNNNLCNIVIENEGFQKPEVINMNKEIDFMENLTGFSRKQLVNRLNKIMYPILPHLVSDLINDNIDLKMIKYIFFSFFLIKYVFYRFNFKNLCFYESSFYIITFNTRLHLLFVYY